jgi:hypothetical protein
LKNQTLTRKSILPSLLSTLGENKTRQKKGGDVKEKATAATTTTTAQFLKQKQEKKNHVSR